MASEVFKQIFDRQIAQFVGCYVEDSSIIFKDEKNNLLHPGEYGKYREEVCKRLLRLVIDKHVDVSDGFVITADNAITTQCDIVVYNADVSPIVTDDFAKMFPAEEVRMIGEIKSTLSKQAFINALRKMAMNKKVILEGRKGKGICSVGSEAEMFDTVASFLVCNKFLFDVEKLTNEEIYGDIDRKFWHNIILSVEDGVIGYRLKFQDFSPKLKAIFEKNNVNIDTEVLWQYPFFSCGDEMVLTTRNFVQIDTKDTYAHIRCFCVELAECSKDVWIYKYDPVIYLGMDAKSVFIEDGLSD